MTVSNPVERSWIAAKRLSLARSKKDQLIEQHRDLVRKIAHRVARQCPEPFEDLEQLGLIGLSKAIDRFDPKNGAAFSSFAVPYIRGEMLHFLRDHGWSHLKVPRRMVETYSTVKRVHRLMLENGQELTELAIAKKLGITEAKWRDISEALDRKPLIQLDEISCLIADQKDDDNGDRQWLTKSLARLSNPYRYCLVERFFKDCTEAEIARQHDVTEEEVRVWLQEGLNKLRAIAEANGNE